MHRFITIQFLTILFLASLLAAADKTLVVREVSVTGPNTYTIEGSGFSPKKGAPVVTINGLAVTVRTFTNTTIVGTLATPVTGDYTVKITNSAGQSVVYNVAGPSPKADSKPENSDDQGVNVGAHFLHPDAAFPGNSGGVQPSETNNRGCNPTPPPGVPRPTVPAYCHHGSDGKQDHKN